jgi:hypothetical protein
MSTGDGKLRACVSFDTMMEQRREQAQRSILVQVHSGLSYQDLKAHCCQFGPVEKTFYYTTREDLVRAWIKKLDSKIHSIIIYT